MYKIVIVILHYMQEEYTKKCVKSIFDTIGYENFHIVIVDNNSSNQSGISLEQYYREEKKVKVLLIKENLGFAKGNNKGYKYAKDVFDADFIYVINNDTYIEQKFWGKMVLDEFEKEKFHVLGPDIITIDGVHQNPLRKEIFSEKELVRTLLKWNLMLFYYKIKEKSPLFSHIQILENYQKKKKDKQVEIRRCQEKQNAVVLHGAALMFSPLYIEKFQDAFNPITFMYMEEHFLALRCRKNDMKMCYFPDLKIIHLEKGSTSTVFNSEPKKKIFYLKESISSGKKFLRLIKKG